MWGIKFMFSESFDWILAVILAVISVLLFIGKGDFFLDLFNGNRENPRKKWPPEKQQKFSKVMGIFTGCLAVAELLMALFAQTYPMVTLGILIFMIVTMIITFRYCKKNF